MKLQSIIGIFLTFGLVLAIFPMVQCHIIGGGLNTDFGTEKSNFLGRSGIHVIGGGLNTDFGTEKSNFLGRSGIHVIGGGLNTDFGTEKSNFLGRSGIHVIGGGLNTDFITEKRNGLGLSAVNIEQLFFLQFELDKLWYELGIPRDELLNGLYQWKKPSSPLMNYRLGNRENGQWWKPLSKKKYICQEL